MPDADRDHALTLLTQALEQTGWRGYAVTSADRLATTEPGKRLLDLANHAWDHPGDTPTEDHQAASAEVHRLNAQVDALQDQVADLQERNTWQADTIHRMSATEDQVATIAAERDAARDQVVLLERLVEAQAQHLTTLEALLRDVRDGSQG